ERLGGERRVVLVALGADGAAEVGEAAGEGVAVELVSAAGGGGADRQLLDTGVVVAPVADAAADEEGGGGELRAGDALHGDGGPVDARDRDVAVGARGLVGGRRRGLGRDGRCGRGGRLHRHRCRGRGGAASGKNNECQPPHWAPPLTILSNRAASSFISGEA